MLQELILSLYLKRLIKNEGIINLASNDNGFMTVDDIQVFKPADIDF